MLLAVLATGCYRATINTGRSPGSTTIEQPWVMGFIFGSIPPATVETASKCPSGVAMVETSHSMLNLLVGSFTGGILTPMTIKVTCATSGRSEGPTIRSAGNPMKAISEAVEQSRASGGPVFVQF